MSDRFMNGVYTEFSIGLSNMWIGHLICRADYNPDQYLWEEDFTLAGRNTKDRTLRLCIISNLRLRNQRGHTLQCSHYVASPFPEDTPLPCVVNCHGNSGCRADANEAAVILLPSNITVFTLDFSGSGLSDGDYARNWADYNPDQYLWEEDFTLAGRKYKRQDLEANCVLFQICG